ncbi:hypothetical protein N8J89_16640 [Crossiella sp. CA-258035]|uniref:hypothetical protein n=1 Tax=Crossiella sp. CA-258035 TaxID=2981138 RepID=UPI0024BC49DC|nr:hypothetical protein [Crossiella sp. CA-258035]WHT22626.1 hypothetical protein N8J89_16640 [Crossiella sp. CA-258035]
MSRDLPTPTAIDPPTDTEPAAAQPVRPRRRHTFLRTCLFATALAVAIGSVVTRDSQGVPLRLDAPQAQAADYVARSDALTGQIMDNDVAMRAVLTHNARALDSEPIRRSLSTIRQLLATAITELRAVPENKIPGPFADSHPRLLNAATLLNQHYEALQKAIEAKNAQDQRQALLASQAMDTQYAQALMAYLKSYQDGLRKAGFTLTEQPR